MHTRWKVIIIVAFVCVAAFFGMKECHGQSAIVLQVLNKLEQGYDLNVVGDNIVAYSQCDTIVRAKSSFTSNELEEIGDMYRAYKRKERDFARELSNMYGRIPIGDYVPDPETFRVYFVAREGVLYNAIGTIAGIDSSRIEISRRSITTAGGQYYRVINMRMAEADTSVLMNAWENGSAHYVVPFTCTLDSLRNYLNNESSVPKWTQEIE